MNGVEEAEERRAWRFGRHPSIPIAVLLVVLAGSCTSVGRTAPAAAALTLRPDARPGANGVPDHRSAGEGRPRDKLAGPVVFHWFAPGRGQRHSAWPPLEGRHLWNGSVGFWKSQDRAMAEAGFNMMLFDVVNGFEEEMRNHLRSLRDLRRDGVPVPRVALFITPESFPCFRCRKRFRNPVESARLDAIVLQWLQEAIDVVGLDGLATVDGETVLLGLWFLPGVDDAPDDLLDRLRDAVRRRLGLDLFITAHRDWRSQRPDEINYLFNGLEPMRRGSGRNADLLVGFWNVEMPNDDRFLPRAAGSTYTMAWESVLAEREEIDRVYVESWNEYVESSGMYPARPIGHTVWDRHPRELVLSCLWQPCHLTARNDYWGADPRLYLRISRRMTDRFLGRTPGPRPR